MSHPPTPSEPLANTIESEEEENSTSDPSPSYTKLAMRNMVKKKGTSLKHFFLTTAGLLALLVGLAYLTR